MIKKKTRGCVEMNRKDEEGRNEGDNRSDGAYLVRFNDKDGNLWPVCPKSQSKTIFLASKDSKLVNFLMLFAQTLSS